MRAKERNWICLFICMQMFMSSIVSAMNNGNNETDTTLQSRSLRVDDLYATSFFTNRNWKEKYNSCIVFSGIFNIIYRKNGTYSKTIHELRSEIGYMRFLDSIWVKNNDNLLLSSIWTLSNEAGIKNSLSIKLKTQLADTWDESYNNGIKERVWRSGPFLPASFFLGYGLNCSFWRTSYLNVSFASMKISSRPKPDLIPPETKYIAKTNRILFNSEYGFNLQSFIEKKLFQIVIWENRTSFFATGIDRKTMIFDMQNILSFKPNRFTKVRFENKMAYDELISPKIQLRYELLIGFSFGNMPLTNNFSK